MVIAMRNSLFLLLCGAAAAAVRGADPVVTIKMQEPPPAKTAPDKAPPPPAQTKAVEIYRTEPVMGVRTRKLGHLQYSGPVVQCFQGNPLQLLNPFAPLRYGTEEGSPARKPAKGEIAGVKVVAVGF